MAFDITPYINKNPSEVRALIREGRIDFPTAGMCAGYAQANLVILPPDYAADFEEYAKRGAQRLSRSAEERKMNEAWRITRSE